MVKRLLPHLSGLMHAQAPIKLFFGSKFLVLFLSLPVCVSCSYDPSLSHEEREKRIQQATGRAGFVQDLFLATMLSD